MDKIIILLVAMFAGLITYFISNILNKGAVLASAVVTLVSGVVLPYFFPTTGGNLAAMAACASYAGMISTKNAPRLWNMAIVSLITGVLYITASNAYVGVGGRLGTIAAISCFTWLGFSKIFLKEKNLEDNKSGYRIVGIKANKTS